MAEFKPLSGPGGPGNFTDVTNSLLPLFCDPDGRGTRRWREMFGLQTTSQPGRAGPYVSVRVGRQSSS